MDNHLFQPRHIFRPNFLFLCSRKSVVVDDVPFPWLLPDLVAHDVGHLSYQATYRVPYSDSGCMSLHPMLVVGRALHTNICASNDPDRSIFIFSTDPMHKRFFHVQAE